MSRGLRNRNPGNIRRSTTTYKGETTSRDPAFKTFESMAWGYRAMFVLLDTYKRRHGCDTLRQMIDRYAPPVENNTVAYINTVASRSHVAPDSRISTDNREVMVPIVSAMSFVENGVPAVAADVEAGWKLFIQYRP
ncbi:structural protein P5 [uncultured Rikenella sp.]|uniref:structural protein P5 n=1 Tax=uncultured Rikenella sp. TaxID=368003 RepID=UPI0027296D01|nr:structural protein P5 [uncultured Rikenella sp.]